MIDGVSALAQPLDQVGGRLAIVFDDEELHRGASRRPFAAAPDARHVSDLLRFSARDGATSARGRIGTNVSASVLASSTFLVIQSRGAPVASGGFQVVAPDDRSKPIT